jgi:hypothetical protein
MTYEGKKVSQVSPNTAHELILVVVTQNELARESEQCPCFQRGTFPINVECFVLVRKEWKAVSPPNKGIILA